MQVWFPRLYLSWLITIKKIKVYHPWAKGIIRRARSKTYTRYWLGLSFECEAGFCRVQSCPKALAWACQRRRGCDKIFVREGPRTWRLVSENLATDYRSHLNHWMLERGYIWSTRLGQEGGDERSRASIVPGMCMVATCLTLFVWLWFVVNNRKFLVRIVFFSHTNQPTILLYKPVTIRTGQSNRPLVHTHWWTKGTGWRLRWASSRASLRLPLSSVDRDQHVRARFRSHIPATK